MPPIRTDQKMKAIIVHSVAANGGDELLLLSTIKSLKDLLDIEVVAISTNSPVHFDYLPVKNKILNDSLLGKPNNYKNKLHILLNKFHFLPYKIKHFIPLFFDADYWKAKSIMNNVEILILSPGGFIHDYYDFSDITSMVNQFTQKGKQVIVMGQSVGPFRDKESIIAAKIIFDNAKKIILREELSKNYLYDLYGCNLEKVEVFTDLAFSYPVSHLKPKTNQRQNRVIVNFREWTGGDLNNFTLVEKASIIINFINDKGYGVDFLSTCQGVKGYRDDTVIADLIQIALSTKKTSNLDFVVYRKKLSIDDYLKKVANYKYYIGMRMHAAIMPILMNVPALNIGYEPKTRGVYSTVDLAEYAIDINDDIESILSNIESFLSKDYDELCKQFHEAHNKGVEKSKKAFLSLREI